MLKSLLFPNCLVVLIFLFSIIQVNAADYVIDTAGGHASITFKIKHLGFSWLLGRFDKFDGTFTYDPDNPQDSKVEVNIDIKSLNSNHAERDKHLKGKNFFYARVFPTAQFVSTSVEVLSPGKAILTGNLTLHGITSEIKMPVAIVGAGNDPWGGYRQGFTGIAKISLADFHMDYDLGPSAKEVIIMLNIEGIRQ